MGPRLLLFTKHIANVIYMIAPFGSSASVFMNGGGLSGGAGGVVSTDADGFSAESDLGREVTGGSGRFLILLGAASSGAYNFETDATFSNNANIFGVQVVV